ncbi:MAG TPA: heme ABC transporter permease [Planctomycetes bacterium]|nr:heme ABC transporter permease [Planctomycetota bacterium]
MKTPHSLSSGRLIALAGLFSGVALAISPAFGPVDIDTFPAIKNWINAWGTPRAEWSADERIVSLRFPRVALAWLAGGCLACAGAVLQSLLRNSLATPYTLGVSAAGSFGAFLLFAFPTLAASLPSAVAPHAIQAAAFLFALIETLIILAAAARARHSDTLLLAGVTLNFLFGAGILLIRHLSDPIRLASMDRWLLGSLQDASGARAIALAIWVVPGMYLLARRAPALDQLALDQELAAARGISIPTVRRDLLFGCGILTAAVVAHTGPIGFIGLLVPHAVRPFAGANHTLLLVSCWLVGGGFLVLADLLARTLPGLGSGVGVPVGIVTALIGGPLFLWILFRR